MAPTRQALLTLATMASACNPCHNTAIEAGRSSDRTEGMNDILYATSEERSVEAFTRSCGAGPVVHPLWQQVEESCGASGLSSAAGAEPARKR